MGKPTWSAKPFSAIFAVDISDPCTLPQFNETQMNSLKKIAVALVSSLALAGTAHAADLPVATDRLPDELQGCWKWNDMKLDKADSIYNRNPAGAQDCKGFGNMLISGDRYVMNHGDGEIHCRLRSVISERRGEYLFRFQCGDEPAFKSTMTLRDNELTVRETTN